MIEHLFDPVNHDDGKRGSEIARKIAPRKTKQNGRVRRLTAVKRHPTSLLAVMLRTGLMVGLAVLLILVLLPAAMAAQATGLR